MKSKLSYWCLLQVKAHRREQACRLAVQGRHEKPAHRNVRSSIRRLTLYPSLPSLSTSSHPPSPPSFPPASLSFPPLTMSPPISNSSPLQTHRLDVRVASFLGIRRASFMMGNCDGSLTSVSASVHVWSDTAAAAGLALARSRPQGDHLRCLLELLSHVWCQTVASHCCSCSTQV